MNVSATGESAAGAGQRASGTLSASLGVLASGGFYLVVWASGSAALSRYFLGHPVAIVATTLFLVAVAVLIQKHVSVSGQWARFRRIRDNDLLPPQVSDSPGGRWRERHDAGHAARQWLGSLEELPGVTRGSLLVGRLRELLTRQTHRGTTKHLADDLRELSVRDADAAHDSLGLVRVIVWAIPMLGFLGTVIGITQTLGGLDFSDGTAAVDRLKSGLYVAFDTTALGLVLSVVAIFLQFPIERSEQRLLAEVDARVGHLLSACLPSDEAADNQTALVSDLCEGIRAAVAESIASQTDLWRQTIDEANRHWQEVRQSGVDEFAESVAATLTPALREHSESLLGHSESLRGHSESLRGHATTLDESLRAANERTDSQVRYLVESLHTALRDHSGAIDESARFAGDRFESQAEKWRDVLDDTAESLLSHHQQLAVQCADLTDTNRRAESLQAVQASLDANLERLRVTNDHVAKSVDAAGGEGMAEAMRILARAVDTLARHLPERPQLLDGADEVTSTADGTARRAA